MSNKIVQNLQKSSPLGVNALNRASSVSAGVLGKYYVKSQAKTPEQNNTERRAKLKHKFDLLAKSKRILRPVIPGGKGNILSCMTGVMQDFVELEKSDGHANFRGVITCKSKHVCPVESPSIAAVEARYIQDAISKCRKAGGDVYMLTLTFRHNNLMSLQYCLDMFHKSLIRFWGCGSVKRFFKSFFHGRITSLEIMWGEKSGWHVHEHILLFGERGLCGSSFGAIDSFFSARWLHALSMVGLSGVDGVASNFQSASAVKDYLTKMSLELTMNNYKQGRAGGLNPWGILELSDEHDLYADLWREYYLATKGKRVIVWSDGLKARYGIKDKSDDEIAEEAARDVIDELRSVVFFVDSSDWRRVIAPDSYNLAYLKTCSILDAAAMLDALGVVWGT